MKIQRITIENFRSVKSLDFFPSEGINAFIGENSTGKSNVFDAIYSSLGPAYPSFNNTRAEDHYGCDENKKIKISLEYDSGETLELAEEWTDQRGQTKSGLNLNSGYVNNDKRQDFCSAYLDTERKIVEYLPSNKWSLIGRILQDVNSLFKEDKLADGTLKTEKLREELTKIQDDLLFSVENSSGENIMKKFTSIIQSESAKQLNKPESDFNINLKLYDPWNYYKTLQLIVREQDTGLEFQASNLGMGVQASITIAILKAYAELNIKNKNPIFIDEPELFLHPQAQRNFYKIIRELANSGVQVFYNTHSPNFLSAGSFNEIFLVKKSPTEGTYIKNAHPERFVKDLKIRKNLIVTTEKLLETYRNACDNTGDSQKANEAFFATKILLVEGQSEALIIPYLFDLAGFDYIQDGLSIVRCGCKSEIDRFYRLYTELGIPCYAMFDGDKQLSSDPSKKAANDKENADILMLFGEDTNGYPKNVVTKLFICFEYSFEKKLGHDFGEVKGLGLYRKVKETLKTKEDLPDWVGKLIIKLKGLNPADVKSCLKEN